MKIKPITINNNQKEEFESCDIDNLSTIAGGYIITPRGEIIVVKDNENHCDVFSKYINNYLESENYIEYNTLVATKMLCEIGCCVYAGIRLEYIKNRLEGLSDCVASLTFPSDPEKLTSIQKEICLKLIESNISIITKKAKIYVQYGSFPANIYEEEMVKKSLNSESIELKKL